MIDLDFVESLIRALDGSGLDSLELERGGTRIRLSKSPTGTSTSVAAEPAAYQGVLSNGAPSAPPAAPAAQEAEPAVEAETPSADDGTSTGSGLVEVSSPMVGTFYRAPSPDSPPYVEVGARVGQGTVLCIIEAMKLMNELECEVEGTIAKVLVEDAQPVEYGQVLFLVDPA
jgi:acetyl-CoA carboxylase biotin carboxyl carrier protein